MYSVFFQEKCPVFSVEVSVSAQNHELKAFPLVFILITKEWDDNMEEQMPRSKDPEQCPGVSGDTVNITTPNFTWKTSFAIGQLFKEPSRLSDLTIVCNSKKFPVHKILLASKSRYIKGAIEKNPNASSLNVDHMSSKQVSSVLEYIYRGSVLIATQDLEDFALTAHELKVQNWDGALATSKHEICHEQNNPYDEGERGIDWRGYPDGPVEYIDNKDGTRRLKVEYYELIDGSFGCGYACDVFSSKEDMMRHLQIMHRSHGNWKFTPTSAGQTFHCYACDFVTNGPESLRIHRLQIHGNEERVQCPECNQQLLWKSLREHRKMIHGNPTKSKCRHCDFETIRKSSLELHERKHHTYPDKNKVKKCPYCEFKITCSLKTHILSMHQGMRIKCPHCSYSHEFDISEHVEKMHENPNLIQCHLCGVKTQKCMMKKHLSVEHPEEAAILVKKRQQEVREIKHCRYCNKRLRWLRGHIKLMHGNQKKRKCPYCPFETIHNISRHVQKCHMKNKQRSFGNDHCEKNEKGCSSSKKNAARLAGQGKPSITRDPTESHNNSILANVLRTKNMNVCPICDSTRAKNLKEHISSSHNVFITKKSTAPKRKSAGGSFFLNFFP